MPAMLNIKSVSLCLLCVVMTAQAVVMHISRTDRAPGVPPYAPAAAVIVTELGKLILSLLLAWREMRSTLIEERDAGAREQLLGRVLPGSSSAVEEEQEGEKQSLLLTKEQQEDASSTVAAPSSAASPSNAEIITRIREDTFGPGWTQLSVSALLFTCQVREH